MLEEPILKKKKKNKNKYIYFSILGIFLFTGLTYALVYFVQDYVSGSMGLTTDVLTIDVSEEGNVAIDNAVPQKDSEGIKNSRTTFNITNNNVIDVKVTIKIEEDLSSIISANDIRYAVFNEDVAIKVGNLGENNNILYEFVLLKGESITLQSTLWLDYYYNGSNEKFSGKYKVEFSNFDEYGYAYLKNLVGKNKGLYAINDDGTLNENGDNVNTYRYSGTNPDNYIKFNNELWRIIGVFDNQIKIVRNDNLQDSAYGSTNVYADSTIRTILDTYYNSTLSKEYRKYVSFYNFNVGGINLTDNATNLLTSENSTTFKGMIGLISASDFLYSTDPQYYSSALNNTDVSSNSWLTGTYWTMNGIRGGTTNVLGINNNIPTSIAVSNSSGIRPSLYLRTDVSIVKGNGTLNNPYQITIKDSLMEIEKISLYQKVEETLADYLLEDDGNARILSGGGGHNEGNIIPDENFKNYVWYSGKLWRIVSLNNDGSIKLVTQDNITNINWGENATFYNKDADTGTETKSWIYEWLNEDFLNTLYNKEKMIVVDAEWDVTPSGETTKITTSSAVGLLTENEYVKSYSKTGSELTGYLNNGYSWCLLTPYETSYVHFVTRNGSVGGGTPDINSDGARPSINLSSDIRVRGGKGSLENPYTLEGDIDVPVNNVTKLNNRVSGEYVNFNSDLYRIVSIENNITKITKADYIRDTSGIYITKYLSSNTTFGSGTTSNYWDYYLNNDWYNSISTSPINYKGMIVSGVYYLGAYPSRVSYKQTICTSDTINQPITNCTKLTTVYEGYVGLGRIGEMFTSQQGTGYSDNENMWTITPYDSSDVRYVASKYDSSFDTPGSTTYGARPSINLSSDIIITSGKGTASEPFEINFG